MTERRCGTCGLWEIKIFSTGDCLATVDQQLLDDARIALQQIPPCYAPEPLRFLNSRCMTTSKDGTDCPCWLPREEKGESDDEQT
jgi:hypothetical protein